MAFYALAGLLPARLAFTLVYLAGIAWVVVATPRLVFGSSSTPARRAALGLWYLATYLLGIGVIAVLESLLSAPRAVVVLGTVGLTAPLSFLGARTLVGGRR